MRGLAVIQQELSPNPKLDEVIMVTIAAFFYEPDHFLGAGSAATQQRTDCDENPKTNQGNSHNPCSEDL